MVFSSLQSNIEEKQKLLDAQEAYNMWSILNSKYQTVEKLKLWDNFTHDFDLKLILSSHLKETQKNITILENKMLDYGVKGPGKNRYALNSPANPEAIHDQFIANEFFIYLQEQVENYLRAFRTSMNNESVRKFFKKLSINTIKEQDKIVQYLKFKGWLETPPLYKSTSKNIDEKISTSEAYHLWDHLAYRYDNRHQTRIYYNFAFDSDYKLILKIGIDQLTKHAKILEKELEYFGITLPRKPPEVVAPPADTELLEDDYSYRNSIVGIQGALTIHAQALKQCTFNDRIRKLFKNLLLEEIDLLDKFIEYGKIKGWLNPSPSYLP